MPSKSPRSTSEATGRTIWDVISQIAKATPGGALAFIAVAILILAAAVQALVHFSADPGSTVSFLGIFAYQKAHERSEPLPTNYVLPKDVELPLSSGVTVLDKTILVRVWPVGVNRRVLRIGGGNATRLHLASRTHSATPLGIRRVTETGELEVVGSADCYVELKYEGRVFGIDVHRGPSGQGYVLSTSQLPKPTMDLRPYHDY